MIARMPKSADATKAPSLPNAPAAPAISAYYLPATILVLAVMAVQMLAEPVPVFPVDDAYITLHNAEVLHWGHDPNYAGTPALAGATSPFHLALVAALLFIFQPLWALNVAAWLGVLAFALGIARLARAQSAPPGAAFLLVVAGLLCARVPHQLMNGLETGWAMAGVTWALAFACEEGAHCAMALAVLCGTLPFLRPELAALSLLLLPLPAWRQWQSGRKQPKPDRTADTAEPPVVLRLTTTEPDPTPLAEECHAGRSALLLFARCAMAALLAALPWVLWQLASTGSIVPATIAAKRYYFAEAMMPKEVKWAWVVGSLIALWRACGPLAAAAIVLPFSRVGRAGLIFIGVLLAAYYSQFPGALTHAQGRYLYILVPFLVFGAASAFHLLHRWPVAHRWMGVFALAAAFQALLLAPFTWREHQGEQFKTRTELAAVARWCNANLPPGSRLLIHDAGYISYATTFPMEDLVGLKTPSNIAFHRDLTYPTAGRQRAAAINAAALRAHPDYVIVLDLWDGIFKITDSLRKYGWGLEEVRTEGIYRVYKTTPPVAP